MSNVDKEEKYVNSTGAPALCERPNKCTPSIRRGEKDEYSNSVLNVRAERASSIIPDCTMQSQAVPLRREIHAMSP